MSLFRKPTKRIQRRVFEAGDDEEEGDPEPPPPPIISRTRQESRPVKSTPLLSFADEEEEGEVFQVKKSTQSKRFTRRREKEKKRIPNADVNQDEPIAEETAMEVDVKIHSNDKPKKKVTLEGLILSGRAALAADGVGDVSDDEGEPAEEPEEETGGFHRFRAESVRAALAAVAAPGHIPDAALIHAARKTRQQARELGDFVPVRPEGGGPGAPSGTGSRLIHDDDDGSGDDEDEGRLLVQGLDLPSDKPKRGTTTSDVEMDSEGEQWEEQQMQKVVPALSDITGMDGVAESNPFAVAPPPPRLDDAPAHLRPLTEPGAPPPATPADLVRALQERLRVLSEERESTAAQKQQLRELLLQRARVYERCVARGPPLDAAYRRAQAARGYVTDLIECIDEKIPELETLESRALAFQRRRCEFLQERRRADVRDQAQDVLAGTGRGGGVRPADYEEKVRRAAEREGRRRARRLKREAAAATQHRDGDSSDDELPPAEMQHADHEREAIRRLSAGLFADALPAWRSVRGVCARLARWRRRDARLYADAYVAECLPKILAPYIRHQLILWNPLADDDNEDYEKMDWYKCLMMYGVRSEPLASDSEESEPNGEAEDASGDVPELTEGRVGEDPDLMLVPTLVHRTVLPKLTELVEHAWDPMCVRACVRLRGLLLRACALPPRASPSLVRLATAARVRLAAAIAADVYLPALPPQVWDGPGGGAAFWRRCLGAGVRLLRAALALCAPPPALHADSLALAIIGTLCTAAGAAPPTMAAGAAAALASTLPPGAPVLRALALRRLASLAQHALNNLHSDNPLHLKALEQARSLLAEARAVQ